jgi:thiol-disulfide isomerase/thioredoxin
LVGNRCRGRIFIGTDVASREDAAPAFDGHFRLIDPMNMKRLTRVASGWVAAVVLAAWPLGAAGPADAETILADARTIASAENRAILVHFGASWCKWCKRLEAFLHDGATEPILQKHFVFVRLVVRERQPNVPLNHPGGMEVLARLGGAERGIPFMAVLDASGELLANSLMPVDDRNALNGLANIGYPGEAKTIAHFLAMLQKAAPNMTATERGTLEAWLVAHQPKS